MARLAQSGLVLSVGKIRIIEVFVKIAGSGLGTGITNVRCFVCNGTGGIYKVRTQAIAGSAFSAGNCTFALFAADVSLAAGISMLAAVWDKTFGLCLFFIAMLSDLF